MFVVSAAVFSLVVSSAAIRRKIPSFAALSAVFFFIGCLVFQARQIFPADHIKNFTTARPQEVYLEGLVVDEPIIGKTFYGGEKVNFTLEADHLQREWIKNEITGMVRVSLAGGGTLPLQAGTLPPAGTLSYGDRILVKGKLSRPKGPGNPGEFDYAKHLGRNRVFSILSAKARDISILENGKGNPVLILAYRTRGKIESLISGNLPGESANFLNAILLGLRQDIGNDLNDAFMRTGTVHLIAISGLNVGLIAFLMLLIFSMIRVPRKVGMMLTIVLLVFYAVLTNGTPSVVRATVMSIAILCGLLIGRETSIWNSLGLAALIILSYDPNALFDVGFQLSFVSVMSLLYITPKLEKFFYYDRKIAARFLSVWRRYILEGFFVSLAAFIGVLPLILYYFNIVTPISVISNLVAVPLSFLVTAASVPFLIFCLIFPPAAKIFAASTWFLCEALFAGNNFFSKMPFAYIYLPKPPVFLIALYYLFLVGFAEHERFKLPIAKLIVASISVFNVIVWTGALWPHDGRLKAAFLDVGHGDSVYVEFPYGGNMLIDGGRGGGEDWDSGRNTVLPFLRQKGIQALDAVVLTHPDIDHVGGLASVLDGLKVRYVFDNGATSDTYAYRHFSREVLENRIAAGRRFILRRGDSIEGVKGVSILCLNPPAAWTKDPSVSVNDMSLALKVGFGGSAMLFCGDIGEKAISEAMLISPPLLKSSLIMLPHHGEKLSPWSEAFIDSVRPIYAVISQGRAAGEVSRSEDTQSLLSAKGIKIFRTNNGGSVFASMDGKNLSVDNFESKYNPGFFNRKIRPER